MTLRSALPVAWAIASISCGAAQPPPSWSLVLRHATVVNGDGSAMPATVAVEGDRIAGVYPETSTGTTSVDGDLARLDGGTQVIDLSGRWLLPGFIDAHVHLLDSASLFTSPDDYDLRRLVPHEEERGRIRSNLPATMRRYLCAGVTTAVSMGGPRWEVSARDALGPDPTTARIVTTGPFFANFPVGEFTLWTSDDPVLVQLKSVTKVDTRLAELAEQGIPLVKIGVASYPSFEMSAFEPILAHFVDVAHARGMRVAAHAEELDMAKAVLRAGIDVLAHVVADRPVDDEFLELARARPIVVTSGISTVASYAQVLDGTMEPLDIETRCGDPVAIQSWSRLEDVPERERPPVPAGVAWGSSVAGRRVLLENTRRMVQAGIAVAAGTNGGQIGSLHGGAFHRELRWLAEAGLTPKELVAAATSNGARVLGPDARRGAVAPGLLADLVVLTEDPLAGVEHFAAIEATVRGGTYRPAAGPRAEDGRR